MVTGNVKADYGDRSEKWTPEFSGLISDTFDTGIGRFGLLANYAKSHVITRTESVIMDKIDTYCSAGAVGSDQRRPDRHRDQRRGAVHGQSVRRQRLGLCARRRALFAGRLRSPSAMAGSFAGQYENNAGTLRATVQYTGSKYHNAWLERASHAILDGNYFGTRAFNPRTSTILGPATGTGPLDVRLERHADVRHAHPAARKLGRILRSDTQATRSIPARRCRACRSSTIAASRSTCATLRDGLYFQNETRNFDHRESTHDLSANVQWDPADNLHANFDVQYITASTYNNDILVATGSMANYQYSVNKDGTPQVTLLPGSNVNYAAGGLANPHNYWIPFIQGHVEDNDADEFALRTDFQYDFAKGGWLDSLKVGVRYATRSQTVRYSTFNWTPIAQTFRCNGPAFNVDNTTPAPYPAGAGCRTGDFPGLWREPVRAGQHRRYL